MNRIREIEKLNANPTELQASWHEDYKDSSYIYIGGINFDMNEGDVLLVFSQYGVIEDINLVRDKTTGRSKGFCFLKYADRKSCVLAIDNLNGVAVVERTLQVDHVREYKMPETDADDEKWKALRGDIDGEMRRDVDDEVVESMDPYLAHAIQKKKQESVGSVGMEVGSREMEDPMFAYFMEKEKSKHKKEESRRHTKKKSSAKKSKHRHSDSHILSTSQSAVGDSSFSNDGTMGGDAVAVQEPADARKVDDDLSKKHSKRKSKHRSDKKSSKSTSDDDKHSHRKKKSKKVLVADDKFVDEVK